MYHNIFNMPHLIRIAIDNYVEKHQPTEETTMICECGHNDFEHGPKHADSLCSLCLCNKFVSVLSKPCVVDLLTKLIGAAQNLLDNPGCVDPDCCATAIKNDEARTQLKEILNEMAKVGK
jgi:hypothetical protein